jgi:hypothetical protein
MYDEVRRFYEIIGSLSANMQVDLQTRIYARISEPLFKKK